MPKPVRRKRGKAKWFLLFLVLLTAGATFAYFRWFKEPTEIPQVILSESAANGTLLGEPLAVTVFSEDPALSKPVVSEALNQLASLENQLLAGLDQLNAAPARQWHQISPPLLELLSHAIEMADLTNGAYDPTLGSLNQLWKKSVAKGELPPADLVTRARFVTGWRYLQLDLPSKSAKRLREGLIIDPGPLLKGFLLDKALEIFRSKGLATTRLVAGNQIRCGLAPTATSGWQVLLPDAAGQLTRVITVANCAVTSQGPSATPLLGNLGKQVNPLTGHGLPVDTGVTIVAPQGVMSSTLATAGRLNPNLVTSLSSATDIHSRVVSNSGIETSSAFPNIEPYLTGAN